MFSDNFKLKASSALKYIAPSIVSGLITVLGLSLKYKLDLDDKYIVYDNGSVSELGYFKSIPGEIVKYGQPPTEYQKKVMDSLEDLFENTFYGQMLQKILIAEGKSYSVKDDYRYVSSGFNSINIPRNKYDVEICLTDDTSHVVKDARILLHEIFHNIQSYVSPNMSLEDHEIETIYAMNKFFTEQRFTHRGGVVNHGNQGSVNCKFKELVDDTYSVFIGEDGRKIYTLTTDTTHYTYMMGIPHEHYNMPDSIKKLEGIMKNPDFKEKYQAGLKKRNSMLAERATEQSSKSR